MADGDREELLAMTDPSSSDAGEYEAVADDAGLSDNESHAASRAGNKACKEERGHATRRRLGARGACE